MKHFLENGLIAPSFLSSREVILFYSSEAEFFILPNGTLFLSELLLEQVLKAGGLESLTFLIVHELSHLVKEHLATNLMQTYAYGDLRKQLFFFTNEYTGYDALLVDHFTNTRYTLE